MCALYGDHINNSLNENVKTTLVRYINGIIKNKQLNESYNKDKKKKEIIKEIELQKVASNNINKDKIKSSEIITDEIKESTETELQKVANKKLTNETLYEKCIKENRLKIQNKFIITTAEYIKEYKEYLRKGYTVFKATKLMNEIFVTKNEEEEE